MERLSRTIKPFSKRTIKVVQFGEGNFLRAFVDPFIQTLNEKGLFDGDVAVIQPVPQGRIKDLEEQDGLYTLILEGLDQGKTVSESKIINVISDYIDPYTQYESYLSLATSPDITTVVSNTTEAGIVFVDEVINNHECPSSFPGKLLAFLHTRFNAFFGDFNKGLDILPCELIDDNGDTLKKVLIELAYKNNMSEPFIHWLTQANRFYNTLVDRIVPGYPKHDAKRLEETFGYMDNSMVKGEIFHLWVIQGETGLNKRLPFDQAGLNVYFVDALKPYKERKVKILNGSHTALVPIAYLCGIDTVKEAVTDPQVNKYIKDLIWNEVIPTINLPQDDMDKFAKSVLERYLNPFVRHELMSIALNSMSKFKSRILPSVLEQLNQGKFPKLQLFSLAANIVFYRGIRNEDVIKLQDEPKFIEIYQNLWAKGDVHEIAETILSLPHWETTRLKDEDVMSYINDNIQAILTMGMRDALAHVMGV